MGRKLKKRRVDKHLPYNFTAKEKKALLSSGISNGCGGNGGFKFDFVMRVVVFIIFISKNFKIKKALQLLQDIRSLCNWLHDIDCYRGGNLKDFWKANKKYIVGIDDLLYWAHPSIQILVKILLTIGLNTFGLLHFNFGKKKELDLLFIH